MWRRDSRAAELGNDREEERQRAPAEPNLDVGLRERGLKDLEHAVLGQRSVDGARRGESVSETWNYQKAPARDRRYVCVLVEVALLRDLQVLGQRAKLLEEAQQVDQLLLRRRLEL